MTFAPTNAADTRTPAQIEAQFEAFVTGNSYLSTRRGNYTERNEGRTPWNTSMDLRLMHDFNINVGTKKHTIQVTFDIINFTNLLNKDWGRVYFVPNTLNSSINVGWVPLNKADVATGKQVFTFTTPQALWSVDQLNSRWQGQLGVRYSF